jgi:signal transduction histidine kinase
MTVTGTESSLVDDMRTLSVPNDTAGPGRSLLTVPLGDDAVLQAADAEVGAYDETDLELLELLADHASATMARIDRESRLRERTAELERQAERLDNFASVVSHDLRNPLQIAEGHLALAREDGDFDRLDTVADAHDRMFDLVEDILTWARHSTLVESTTPVSLVGVVDDSRGVLGSYDASLVVEDCTVAADYDRLRQLFENLLRNAAEHGPRAVSIRVGPLDDRDGFFVEDDGPGIPPDERDDAFDPGYTTSQSGTGFGLNIVDEIATAHGWEVSVTDGRDGGARFEVTGVDVLDDEDD